MEQLLKLRYLLALLLSSCSIFNQFEDTGVDSYTESAFEATPKSEMRSIELDIDDDNLLRYMKYAHEKDMTFNELTIEAVKEMLNKADFERGCG